jgi:hypothetical protein
MYPKGVRVECKNGKPSSEFNEVNPDREKE